MQRLKYTVILYTDANNRIGFYYGTRVTLKSLAGCMVPDNLHSIVLYFSDNYSQCPVTVASLIIQELHHMWLTSHGCSQDLPRRDAR